MSSDRATWVPAEKAQCGIMYWLRAVGEPCIFGGWVGKYVKLIGWSGQAYECHPSEPLVVGAKLEGEK